MISDKPTPNSETDDSPKPGLLVLALGALGVVYGDIGTSPLYAIRECFHGQHAIALNPGNILGCPVPGLLVSDDGGHVKYVGFILKADNRGEGGIFALLALLLQARDKMSARSYGVAVLASVFGAALLYGDGLITPAISVLSAIEGLEVATKASKPFIIPLTCIVLFLLFLVQRRGTADIGRFFGPIMILWFLTIGTFGLFAIVERPQVVSSLNPWRAVEFFRANHLHGMVVLGSVVLCITGGEALYADMGHFSPRAIKLSWLGLAYPALLLNYFGQGALLLSHPEESFHPFYGLVPKMLLYPAVMLSTIATIIASQAMISGVFSLTQQAVQLGLSAPGAGTAHLGRASGPDLPSRSQLGHDGRLHRAGAGLPGVHQPGRCLRHCRDRHHGHYLDHLLPGRHPALELVVLEGRTAGRIIPLL